jgi:hypothetical protein
METEPQRLKEQDGAPSSLNAAIEVVNVSKDLCGIASATVAFGSVSALLTMIRVQHSVYSATMDFWLTAV